jgi:hypothetical protein
MDRWDLDRKIEKIIKRNCEEIPWEGTEVDTLGLREDIFELIDEIKKETIKDFITKQLGWGGNTEDFIEKFNEQNESDYLYDDRMKRLSK